MLHQIGVGALGPVFRTYEPTRDRLVAVKVFRLDITPEQSQSLADELATAAEAGLFHPSVVEPIASGVEGTLAYRAEEYVAAESLDVAMRHYAPAPAEKILPFITQLAGAIDFARTAGIGHGALHPRDVFLTPDEARATGFGVVEALERVGLRAPVRRPYTAPERVAGQPWSTPADVFSLAAIAYEMLTGRRPAGTGLQIGALTGGNSDALHEVLARAMDDDPARRYPSALQFVSAFGAARSEAPRRSTAAGTVTSPGLQNTPTAQKPDPVVPVANGLEFALARDDDAAEDVIEDVEIDSLAGDELSASDHLDDIDEIDDADDDDLVIDEPPPATRFADDFVPPIPAAPRRQDRLFEEGSAVTPPPRGGFSPSAIESRRDDEDVRLGDVHTTDTPARSGFRLVPFAIMLILGMGIAFGAGYALGGRTDSAAGTAPSTELSKTGGAKPEAAKDFSDQAVNPPPAKRSAAPPSAATPSAATPSAATTGRLVVQSTPSGAAVTVDGRVRGRTPLTIEQMAFRSYSVTVAQSGFVSAREEVRLTAGAPSRTVTLQLQRRAAPAAPPTRTSRETREEPIPPGSLYIDSRPRGARVFVDGKPVGVTPVRVPDVPSGSHVVRLELPDHRPWTTSARVRAGEQERVSGSLELIR
ncbi:MAG: PEGA domain-containing protein [Vicinamibacterales bacterium]